MPQASNNNNKKDHEYQHTRPEEKEEIEEPKRGFKVFCPKMNNFSMDDCHQPTSPSVSGGDQGNPFGSQVNWITSAQTSRARGIEILFRSSSHTQGQCTNHTHPSTPTTNPPTFSNNHNSHKDTNACTDDPSPFQPPPLNPSPPAYPSNRRTLLLLLLLPVPSLSIYLHPWCPGLVGGPFRSPGEIAACVW